MNNLGQDNFEESSIESGDAKGVPWWILGVALFALLLAILITIRIGGVLAGLLFPPMPPIPVGAEVLEHGNRGYGADDWVYTLRPSPCFAASFYDEEGGMCVYEPGYCHNDDTSKRDVLVASCEGIEQFSNFFMVWKVEIRDFPEYAELNLSRDITWFASAPIRPDQ